MVEEHYDDVLAYCRRHAPSYDDAPDVAQEAFLRFVRSGRSPGDGKPLAYLFTIARNLCIDAARAKRPPAVPLDVDVPDRSPDADPAAACAGSEVGALVEALDPELREVVELRFDQGFKVGEIAQRAGRVAVRGEPAAQPGAGGAAARVGRKGRGMSGERESAMSSGCCGRTTAPSAARRTRLRRRRPSRPCARVATERPRGASGCGGRASRRRYVRRVRGRAGALHPPARVGGPARARGRHGGALPARRAHAPRGFPLASGVLAAATVLVGLPDLLSSAAHRVAELEYACRFDCRAVALARLIVLGCSDVVTVTAIALAAPVMLGADPFASLVHACAPYFLSCAGALVLVRRCPPSQALPLGCAWTLLGDGGAYAAFSLVPDAYAQASAWAWALVAAGSLAWAAREARAWLGGIAGGLDMLASSSTHRCESKEQPSWN